MLIQGIWMPQRVICHGCNHVLYEGKELKPPDEIIAQTWWKMPEMRQKTVFVAFGCGS